ncbi:MAG: leucine-rich repeat protein [Clostridia bacterium]|nr:leucine-rich repeat protein [Clostridia bacterium]
MNKYKSFSFSVLFVLLVAFSLLFHLPINNKNVYANSEVEIVESGKFEFDETNISWSLDSEGVLTFSGSGTIPNEENWLDRFIVLDQAKSIVIKNGITGLAEGVFRNFQYVESIVLPKSITVISNNAFCGCKALTSLTIPDTVIEIGYKAFIYCENLKTIKIPENIQIINSYTFVFSYVEKLILPCGLEFNILDYYKEESTTQGVYDTKFSEGDVEIEYYHTSLRDWRTIKDSTTTEYGKQIRTCDCGEIEEFRKKDKLPKEGLSVGAIVGITLGSVFVLGIVVFVLVWFVIKKKTWSDFVAIFKKK